MWRVLLAVVVVAVIVSAQLTVAVAVPDLSYIAGLYDGGDLDALLGLVSDQVPVVVGLLRVVRAPTPVTTLAPEALPTVVAVAPGPCHTRAPPLG
jgi:hypothetical protein